MNSGFSSQEGWQQWQEKSVSFDQKVESASTIGELLNIVDTYAIPIRNYGKAIFAGPPTGASSDRKAIDDLRYDISLFLQDGLHPSGGLLIGVDEDTAQEERYSSQQEKFDSWFNAIPISVKTKLQHILSQYVSFDTPTT